MINPGHRPVTNPLRIDGGTSAEQWRMVEHLLACRCGSCCECCGHPFTPGLREPSIHHRRNRGMGGTSRPTVRDLPELLLICAGRSRRLAGALGCHGWIGAQPALAEQRGLLVPKACDPAAEPLTLHSGRRVLLAADGPFYLPAPGPPYAATVPGPAIP